MLFSSTAVECFITKVRWTWYARVRGRESRDYEAEDVDPLDFFQPGFGLARNVKLVRSVSVEAILVEHCGPR